MKLGEGGYRIVDPQSLNLEGQGKPPLTSCKEAL